MEPIASRPLCASTRNTCSSDLSALERAGHTVSGFVEGVAKSLTPASETPLNVPIGPHRRFDWTRFDMEAVKQVGKMLDRAVDSVLAIKDGRKPERHLLLNPEVLD